MINIIIFYFLFLTLGLCVKSKKLSCFFIFVGCILSIIDYIAYEIGNHIQFIDLFRMHDNVVSAGFVMMPIHFILLTIFLFAHLGICYLVCKNKITKVRFFIPVIFIGCSCLFPDTYISYFSVIKSSVMYGYYCTYTKEELKNIISQHCPLINTEVYQKKETANKKNIIVIYCESLENAILNLDNGKYMPNLNKKINNNELFMYNNYEMLKGSDATINALYATHTGVPLFLRVRRHESNDMGSINKYGVSYANILNKLGYNSIFVTGSNVSFACTDVLLNRLGYRIAELSDIDNESKHEVWGYHDNVTFRNAKRKVFDAIKSNEPFNMMILTVDTHFPVGIPDNKLRQYIDSSIARDSHEYSYAALDYLVSNFLDYIKEIDKDNNTTVLVIGDHLLMGSPKITPLVGKFNDNNRRITFLCNQRIENIKQNDSIGFYDFPYIIFELAGIQKYDVGFRNNNVSIKKYIEDNQELFFAYMHKCCKQ